MTRICAENLSVIVKGARLLDSVTLNIGGGELVAVVGPNGAGKSTLARTMLGAIVPTTGRAMINTENAAEMAPLKRARLVSYLPQLHEAVWPVTVRDVVALGRFAYGSSLGDLDLAGTAAVEAAIKNCGLTHLRERRTDTLSGGELARTHCARVFASQAPLLIADEPISALDPAGQISVLGLLRGHVDQASKGEHGAMIILHDLSLAAAVADRMVWMRDGRIVADGPPAETVTAARIGDVFGVSVIVDTIDNAPFVRYLKAAPGLSKRADAP